FNGASCSNGANGTLVYIERDPTGDIEALAVEDGVFVARDNTVSTHLDINTAPAGTGTLAGTVTFPPGVDEVEVAPVMKIGDAYAIMDGRTVAAVAPNFTLKVPVFAGVEYRVLVTKNLVGSSYRWAWSEVVTAPASGITVALGDVAKLLSPSGPLTDTSPTFTYSEAASTNLYSVLVVQDGALSHIAMSDETTVTVPALPAPNQLTGDYLWAAIGITARDADSIDDLLDGRMIVGLHHLNYPLNEPDRVRSGFVNSNFLEFSLP